MAITAAEMSNIKDLLEEVITRRIDPRFNVIEARLGRIEEDVTVIKDMVKDHSFEIARLKHKTA